jgi:hypothetical protein
MVCLVSTNLSKKNHFWFRQFQLYHTGSRTGSHPWSRTRSHSWRGTRLGCRSAGSWANRNNLGIAAVSTISVVSKGSVSTRYPTLHIAVIPISTVTWNNRVICGGVTRFGGRSKC